MEEQSKAVIEMLREDMEGEHGAIIQYLLHAYALGEGEFAAEIEAIARDEMRHLHWLAEEIVERGGKPSMKLGPVTVDVDDQGMPIGLGSGGPTDWMGQNVGLERDAISLYRKHAASIDDPTIVRLLRRIIADEEHHAGIFANIAGKMAREGLEPELTAQRISGDEEMALPGATAEILQQGVRHEYTVVLQYLYHSFLAPCEISEELEMQAINEMQHMGWFAEEMAGNGILPRMGHEPFDTSENTADMLRADIAAERAVTMDYEEQIRTVEDAGLKELLSYVRGHEIYHDELFSSMLEEVRKSEAAQPKRTVGSLLGKRQG
jgi:bacterioferritin